MRRLIFVFALLPTVALAQPQQTDPAVLQRAIAAIQLQRNAAWDAAASAEIRAAGLADDLAKAQARIKELEPKPAEVPAK